MLRISVKKDSKTCLKKKSRSHKTFFKQRTHMMQQYTKYTNAGIYLCRLMDQNISTL